MSTGRRLGGASTKSRDPAMKIAGTGSRVSQALSAYAGQLAKASSPMTQSSSPTPPVRSPAGDDPPSIKKGY